MLLVSQDELDHRADALNHMTFILSSLSFKLLPSAIIIENVKPFIVSESWKALSSVRFNVVS